MELRLPADPRYSTDQQLAAVTHQETQQCASKGKKEEDCKLATVNVNNHIC